MWIQLLTLQLLRGASSVVVPQTTRTDVGGSKKKHHVPYWDTVWERPDVPVEVVEAVEVKALAKDTAEAIISHRREISRIKTQMRLSSNEAALSAMSQEIDAIERHLKRVKDEADETLILMLLL